MEERLDVKITELYKIAKLYEDLVKKDYSYNYRLDGIYLQIEVLEDLKNGSDNEEKNWMVCYKEDSSEVEQK